jgi:hypothetical protein
MKTKSILSYLVPVIISGVLVSCSSSNKVASNFGKRHYTKGFFFDRPGKPSNPAVNTATVAPKSHVAIATAPVVKEQTQTTVTPVIENKVSSNSVTTAPVAKKSNFVKRVIDGLMTNTVVSKNVTASPATANVQSSESTLKSGSESTGGGGNCKSRVVSIILCILLYLIGVGGIHRFYMGYIWQGVVQLLTFGGCGIWQLIDFYRICFGDLKPKDGDWCQ